MDGLDCTVRPRGRPSGRDAVTPFARYAWAVLGYNLLVVLWGAFVRASGSGAGCGDHWPLCNGVVVPRAPALETVIELTHRVTSALAGVLVIILLVWAFRAFARGHAVRRAAVAAMGLMLTEGAVGAGLVIFQKVAHDDSIGRAWWLAAHLVNTFLLLAALGLTAWWGSGFAPPRRTGRRVVNPLLGLAALALLVGVTGAVTALGDTLFPAGTLREGLAQDVSPTAHLLVRLRVWHPLLAVGFAMAAWYGSAALARGADADRVVRGSARMLQGLVALQVVGGAINVLLLAPTWMQLVHLLVADLVWLALILFGAARLAAPSGLPTETGSGSPAGSPAGRRAAA